MKRIDYLIQKLASAAIHLAPLAFVAGFLGAPVNVHAASLCYGGSVILNSTYNRWLCLHQLGNRTAVTVQRGYGFRAG